MNKAALACALLIISFCTSPAEAQKLTNEQLVKFQATEDSLIITADSMYKAYIPNERLDFCYKFVKQLSHLLKEENSFYYPFEKLSKKIHILYPENKSFRIFNWSVIHTPNNIRYYGAVQMEGSTNKLFPLLDQSAEIDNNELYGQLSNQKWYGCEYYRILTQKDPTGNPIYFLFGLNMNGNGVSTKVIDVASFNPTSISFGGNYFGGANAPGAKQRFILQYQKGAQVSLNYDNERNMITFDRLVSEINQPERKNTLVPSGNIDGLFWNNFKWEFKKDIIPIMKLSDGQAPINGVIQK